MQMLQQQQLLQSSMNDPMSNLLAQQMAQLQMQQQLTFQQPLAYPSVSSLNFDVISCILVDVKHCGNGLPKFAFGRSWRHFE